MSSDDITLTPDDLGLDEVDADNTQQEDHQETSLAEKPQQEPIIYSRTQARSPMTSNTSRAARAPRMHRNASSQDMDNNMDNREMSQGNMGVNRDMPLEDRIKEDLKE
jgi:hypothetical protein